MRHGITGLTADKTRCGIKCEDAPDTKIGCECGHPLCKHPVECPQCLVTAKPVMDRNYRRQVARGTVKVN